MITFYKFWVGVVISSFLIVLSGCSINNPLSKHALALSPENLEQLSPTNAISSSTNLLEERRSAETSKYYVPTISAVGFSSIAIQPSKSLKTSVALWQCAPRSLTHIAADGTNPRHIHSRRDHGG